MQRTKKNRKEERRKEGGKEGRTLPTNIYRTSIIHPTNINRKTIEHLLGINQKSIEYPSDENPSKINPTNIISIYSENNKIHAESKPHDQHENPNAHPLQPHKKIRK